MKQPQIQLEEIKIPEISEADLIQTILHSKQILQESSMVKQERSRFQSLKQIIVFHGWRSLCVQGLLVFFLLVIAWIGLPVVGKNISIAFVLVSSVTLSVAISYELYRVDLYQMKELEYTCVFSPQRLFVWKILLLSMISLIGILLLCIYTSNTYELNLLTLIYGGCIPFIILNGISLQLSHNQNAHIVFGSLCLIFLFFLPNLNELYLQAMEKHGLFYFLLAVIYFIGMNLWVSRKKAVL